MKTAIWLFAGASLAASSLLWAAEQREIETLHKGTTHRDLYAVAVDPADADAATAVGAFGTILQTTDGGKTWENANYDTDRALIDIAHSGSRQIVVGQSGLIMIRDGGDEWQKIETDTTARFLGVASNTDGLAYAVGQFGAVYKSTDGGSSWQAQDLELSKRIEGGYDPHLYDVHLNEQGVATIIGEFGLVLRNAGPQAEAEQASAEEVEEEFDEEETEEEEETTESDATAASDEGSDSSAASGESEKSAPAPAEATGESVAGEWEIVNTADESLFSLHMRDDGVGFAVGQSGVILRTEDGGKSWAGRGAKLDANLLGVWAGKDGTITVPGFRRMLVSDDNGETWRQVLNQDVNRGWYIDVTPIGSEPGVVSVGYSGKIIRIKKAGE